MILRLKTVRHYTYPRRQKTLLKRMNGINDSLVVAAIPLDYYEGKLIVLLRLLNWHLDFECGSDLETLVLIKLKILQA